jgi:hypothetical protein
MKSVLTTIIIFASMLPCMATSMPPISVEQKVRGSEHIFIGVATKLEITDPSGTIVSSPQADVQGDHACRLTVKIMEVIMSKADPVPKSVTVTYSNKWIRKVDDEQNAYVGKKLIYFLCGKDFTPFNAFQFVESVEKASEIMNLLESKSEKRAEPAGAGQPATTLTDKAMPFTAEDRAYRDTLVGSLHGFAEGGDLTAIKGILESHPEFVNVRRVFPQAHKPMSTDGFSLLHRAAGQGRGDVIAYLIEKGADVKATDGMGWTPLHVAAQKDFLPIVKQLVEHGASVDAATKAVAASFEVPPCSAEGTPPCELPAVPSLTPWDLARAGKHAEVVAYLTAVTRPDRDAATIMPRMIWRETSVIPIEKVPTPDGFKVTPAEAVKPIMARSTRAPWAEFYLFVDSTSYYFGNTRKGAELTAPPPGHYVIDGMTGKITDPKPDGGKPAP